MRNVHCVTATYESVRHGACREKALVRVKAGGRALFCQGADFTEPDFFDRLPEGAEVFLGVQAFADGTFWLHWLHSPEHGTLEPEPRSI